MTDEDFERIKSKFGGDLASDIQYLAELVAEIVNAQRVIWLLDDLEHLQKFVNSMVASLADVYDY